MKLLTPLALRWAGAFTKMRNILVAHMGARPALVPTLQLTYNRLGRTLLRLDRLLHRFATGRLGRPGGPGRRGGPVAASGPRKPEAAPRPRLPASQNWLAKLLGPPPSMGIIPTAEFHNDIQNDILADPQTKALIAAAPKQAGRILRPLCRMLGVPLPDALKPPKRSRAPKPRAPKPACIAPKPRPPRPDDLPERHRLVIRDHRGRRHKYWLDWS